MVAEDGDLDRILAEVLKLQAEAEKRNPRHPTQEDREIAERLRSHITAGTLGQYEATLPDEERRDVSALAIRGAALALYDDDPSIIELAVCAACMGGLTPGSRESMIDMSCVADASQRLGIPSPALAEYPGVQQLGAEAAEAVRQYMDRDDLDEILKVMGYTFRWVKGNPVYAPRRLEDSLRDLID